MTPACAQPKTAWGSRPGGREAALLCDASLRRPLRQVLARSIAELSVIAYQEVPTDLLLEPITFVRPEDLGGPPAKAA